MAQQLFSRTTDEMAWKGPQPNTWQWWEQITFWTIMCRTSVWPGTSKKAIDSLKRLYWKSRKNAHNDRKWLKKVTSTFLRPAATHTHHQLVNSVINENDLMKHQDNLLKFYQLTTPMLLLAWSFRFKFNFCCCISHASLQLLISKMCPSSWFYSPRYTEQLLTEEHISVLWYQVAIFPHTGWYNTTKNVRRTYETY